MCWWHATPVICRCIARCRSWRGRASSSSGPPCRSGWAMPRRKSPRWWRGCAEMMLASTRIFADETVVPVLDPGRGRTKQGYFWAMARDDRPWGGSQPPAVVYSYAPGRGHTHANTLLGGYRGILQCDGYAAYKKFTGSRSVEPSVTLAFCWSHVRRGFYDLAKAKAPIATETLQRI